MEEAIMERIPYIYDGSLTGLWRFGSGVDTGETNGRSTSRSATRRHGCVFGGHENDAGRPFVMSYPRSQGIPEKQISLYLLSHAKTTERADMHGFTLMDKISRIYGLNLQAAKSRDEAKLCLVNMVALARDYVDPKTNHQTPITQCEKM
jgi:hypothetical protein